MSGPGIAIDALRVAYAGRGGAIPALDGVTLEVGAGEFVCVVGPSGCGKTTLLRVLAGLREPTSGTVHFGIETGDRPLRAMVFQEHGVFPWLTVLDNAAYGLRARGVPREEADARAMRLLERLGLAAFAQRFPRELSGGMRQRVNIARAFAVDPAVLLMDEPLAALDEQTRLLVQDDLLSLWSDDRKSVVYVTHSLEESIALGDRVVVLSRRPATVKAIVPIDIPRPRRALELQNDPHFARLRARIWEPLRDEVLASRAEVPA